MPGTGTVTPAAGLNLRQSASTSTTILAKLPKDTKLDILAGEGTDWLNVRVQTSGQVGFVSAQYVTVTVSNGSGSGSGTGALATQPGFLVSDHGLLAVPLVPGRLLNPQTDGVGATIVRIWNSFGNLVTTLSATLGIPASVVVAVLAAESGGRTGDANGRMIIRFENHIFWNLWGKANADTFNRFFRFNQTEQTWTGHQFRSSEAQPFADFHGNQDAEWTVLTFARTLNDTAALSSISMGAPQVMGFNFRRLGYNSVQDMFTGFSTSQRAQLIGIFDFVRGTAAVSALQSGDYLTFAKFYNGSGNAETYRSIIAAYVSRFNALMA